MSSKYNMLVIVLLVTFLFAYSTCIELDYSNQVSPINEEKFDSGNNMDSLYQTVRFLVDRNNELESRMKRLENQYLTDVKKLNKDFHDSLRKHKNRIVVLERKLRKQTEFAMKLKKGNNKFELVENGSPHAEKIEAISTEKRNTQEQHSKRLLEGIQPQTTSVVAFYAYMSTSHKEQGQHTLVFDTVKTNVGQAYHPGSGVFAVPLSGTYVFTWTIIHDGAADMSVLLMVNAGDVGAAYANSHDGDQVTGTAVVNVNQGDHVYVRTYASWSTGSIKSDSAGRSSFAGWKLD